MDIQTFLDLTRRSTEVLTENAPGAEGHFFELYEELTKPITHGSRIPLSSITMPELILSRSALAPGETQLITLDRSYICVELSQIERLSSIWSGLEVVDGDNRSLLEDRLDILNGAGPTLKHCIALIIGHELAHYLKRDQSWNKIFETFKAEFAKTRLKPVHFDYVDDRLERASAIIQSESQLEEIYCDDSAITLAWKLCVLKWPINPGLMSVSVSIFFGSLYFLLYQSGRATSQGIRDLFARRIYAMRRICSFYDSYAITLMDYSPEFEAQMPQLIGAHELVLEYAGHLVLRSAAPTEGGPRAIYFSEIMHLEQISVYAPEIREEQFAFLEVPADYFAAVIAHHLPVLTLVEGDFNPMMRWLFTEGEVSAMWSAAAERGKFVDTFWSKES